MSNTVAGSTHESGQPRLCLRSCVLWRRAVRFVAQLRVSHAARNVSDRRRRFVSEEMSEVL